MYMNETEIRTPKKGSSVDHRGGVHACIRICIYVIHIYIYICKKNLGGGSGALKGRILAELGSEEVT